jgi:hypothetical protein
MEKRTLPWTGVTLMTAWGLLAASLLCVLEVSKNLVQAYILD